MARNSLHLLTLPAQRAAAIRLACAASLCALALASARPAAQVGTGRITGKVTLTTRIRGRALPSNVYAPRAVQQHDMPPAPEIRNVVVYVKDAKYTGPLPVSHAEIRQEHETFLPHVLAVTRGSTVDFPNADPFFHDVFSLSSAATFDLGHYAPGQSRTARFQKPGLVKVYCHIHSQMSATILVLPNPYFAIPDDAGSFSLENVPAGRYTLVGWHERVGERTTTVEIEPGRETNVNLSLPVEDSP